MAFLLVFALAALALLVHADDNPGSTSHGQGDEGTIMGPVAFLWPEDRVWSAAYDNIGPCGSQSGVGNRTQYPLSQGSVALSIADEAYFVAFRLAVGNNPTQQSDFDDQIVNNVTEIAPGHQCYKIESLEGITAGTNATIQLEYWAEYDGENNNLNESFYACADITFVRTESFSLQVPCFNVTAVNFSKSIATATATASKTGSTVVAATTTASSRATTSVAPATSGGSGGLSSGAKAGIAVGSIVGGLALLSAIAFFLYRRGKSRGLQNRESYELRAKKLGTGEEAASTAASARST